MITDDIVENFEKINSHFDLDLYEDKKAYRGPCPLHDGDNQNSLAIFKKGREVNGIWKCYTAGCHEKYGKNIIGFIRGLLSIQAKRETTYNEAVNWCEEFFGGKL